MWVLNMEGLSTSTGTEVNATSNITVCHHPVVLFSRLSCCVSLTVQETGSGNEQRPLKDIFEE